MTATMVAVLEPEAKQEERSARARLREWVREYIDGKRDVRAPEVATAALAELASDSALMAGLGREMLRSATYEVVLDVIAATRATRDDVDSLPGPAERTNGTDSRAALNRRLASLERRYTHWMEHVGDRHIRLIDLKAQDLEVAETERRTRSINEGRIADFLAILRVRLGKSGKAVGEKLSYTQIEELRVACMAPAQKEEEPSGDL